MKNRYLIKIETVTGKTLYIDNEDQVITEDYLTDNTWFDDTIVFMTDIQNAMATANLYGGKVVKIVMAVRSVSDE